MSDKTIRNICLVMFVVQCLFTVAYVTDIALKGNTKWWQACAAGFIAVVMFMLFDKYRRRVKKNE